MGLPVTNPERTIVDAFEAASQPDQFVMATRQALQRGMTTPRRLRAAAAFRSPRAAAFVEHAIETTSASGCS
jgi:hypothetical protein